MRLRLSLVMISLNYCTCALTINSVCKMLRQRSSLRCIPADVTTEANKLVNSLSNARTCSESNISPGAGLLTAEEQSDAAYADIINTSMDQSGKLSLSKDELQLLNRGSYMWEEESLVQENKLGIVGDLVNLLKALFGGAHIEKNKFGETAHSLNLFLVIEQEIVRYASILLVVN